MIVNDTNELKLLAMYRKLNTDGKRYLLLQAGMMVDTVDLIKQYVESDGICYIQLPDAQS